MPSYYPGRPTRASAAIIFVNPGAKVEGLQLVLPEVGPARTIRIRVVDESGEPVKGALVSSSSDAPGGKRTSDVDGWLTAEGFEGASYTLSVRNGQPVEIPRGKGPLTLQLVVRPIPR